MSMTHAKPAQQLLCTSKNGVSVTYDPIHSHAATHLQDTPQLKSLLTELISKLILDGQEVKTYVDMGRIVGTCDVVSVDASDKIIYGMRKNRADDGLVPFTKTRPAEPCPNVALHLVSQPDGTCELLSAWIGTLSDDDEPFPQSPRATANSVAFWNRYAFVYGSQDIVPGTLTADCPW